MIFGGADGFAGFGFKVGAGIAGDSATFYGRSFVRFEPLGIGCLRGLVSTSLIYIQVIGFLSSKRYKRDSCCRHNKEHLVTGSDMEASICLFLHLNV